MQKHFLFAVLERPPSQMSYLDQFLKETNSSQQSQVLQYENMRDLALLHQGGSVESEEGDIEDNRALSISSSKSNLSESSMVSETCIFKKLCLNWNQQLKTVSLIFFRVAWTAVATETQIPSVSGANIF